MLLVLGIGVAVYAVSAFAWIIVEANAKVRGYREPLCFPSLGGPDSG